MQEREDGGGLRLEKMEMFPTIIESFRVRRLEPQEADSDWVRRKIQALSGDFRTDMEAEPGG